MNERRTVAWEGFPNARDLGGLPLVAGGATRMGVFYRSATVDYVTDAGWRQAHDAGVRTVIDLRNDDEIDPQITISERIARRHIPLDGIEDAEFWEPYLESGLHGTPLYYEEFLRQKSDRVAAVLTGLADAEGAIVFHCAGGRDRTGLVTLLLLGLAGVEPDAAVDDYLTVGDSLRALQVRLGRPDEQPEIDALLTARGVSAQQVVRQLLTTWEPASYLRESGVSDATLGTLRARLAG